MSGAGVSVQQQRLQEPALPGEAAGIAARAGELMSVGGGLAHSGLGAALAQQMQDPQQELVSSHLGRSKVLMLSKTLLCKSSTCARPAGQMIIKPSAAQLLSREPLRSLG